METKTVVMRYSPEERDTGYAQFARIAQITEAQVVAAKSNGQNCHSRREVPEDKNSICAFYADMRDGDMFSNRWSVSMSYAANHASIELHLTVAGRDVQEIWRALESVIEPDRISPPRPYVEPCIDDELQ